MHRRGVVGDRGLRYQGIAKCEYSATIADRVTNAYAAEARLITRYHTLVYRELTEDRRNAATIPCLAPADGDPFKRRTPALRIPPPTSLPVLSADRPLRTVRNRRDSEPVGCTSNTRSIAVSALLPASITVKPPPAITNVWVTSRSPVDAASSSRPVRESL